MTAPVFTSYQNWLKSKSYSDATIRNYLMDLRKYIAFTVQVDRCVDPLLDEHTDSPLQITDKIFDQDNLVSYFQNINQDQNYKRFLASLSKFFQFALDQHLISQNPFPKAIKVQPETNLEETVKLYQQQLEAKKLSLSTIRNYINDIHQYINFCETQKLNDQFPISNDQKISTFRKLKLKIIGN